MRQPRRAKYHAINIITSKVQNLFSNLLYIPLNVWKIMYILFEDDNTLPFKAVTS